MAIINYLLKNYFRVIILKQDIMDNNDLRDNTIKMYDQTIEEMVKRGCPKSSIDAIEKAKTETIAAYDYCDDAETKIEYSGNIPDRVFKILGGMYNFTPLIANMFVVKMADIPIYLFQSVSVDLGRKEIVISLFESPTFSTYKYFSEHKKFDEMKIEFLDNVGAVQRIDLFEGLKVKALHLDSLYYESDHALTAQITFKYKKYVPAAN